MTTMIGKICITIAMLTPVAALAAPQSVSESAQYTLADNDSRNDARQICASTAKRTALDKAGSLFESDLTAHESEANGTMAGDTRLQMRSYVAAVVGSEVVAEHFDVNNDRLRVSCTVRITFDPNEVGKKLQDIAGSSELRQKLAAQQAQVDILENQVRKLSSSATPSLPDRAAAPPPPVLSNAPPAISNRALDQSAPSAQLAQAPQVQPSALPPPQYVLPRPDITATAPVPVLPPAQAQILYQRPTAYPPPPPAYYYYRPVPAYRYDRPVPTYYYYYPPVTAYPARFADARRVAYGGWYYASRPQ
jgi:hypothetical protein